PWVHTFQPCLTPMKRNQFPLHHLTRHLAAEEPPKPKLMPPIFRVAFLSYLEANSPYFLPPASRGVRKQKKYYSQTERKKIYLPFSQKSIRSLWVLAQSRPTRCWIKTAMK